MLAYEFFAGAGRHIRPTGVAVEAVQVGVLTSWKEIATYLNRSVRTVQRWESLGLPVRRMHAGSRAPVIAASVDLDRWIHSANAHGFDNPQNGTHLLVRGTLAHTIQRSRTLRDRTSALRHDGRLALDRLIATIEVLQGNCGTDRKAATRPEAHRAEVIGISRAAGR